MRRWLLNGPWLISCSSSTTISARTRRSTTRMPVLRHHHTLVVERQMPDDDAGYPPAHFTFTLLVLRSLQTFFPLQGVFRAPSLSLAVGEARYWPVGAVCDTHQALLITDLGSQSLGRAGRQGGLRVKHVVILLLLDGGAG